MLRSVRPYTCILGRGWWVMGSLWGVGSRWGMSSPPRRCGPGGPGPVALCCLPWPLRPRDVNSGKCVARLKTTGRCSEPCFLPAGTRLSDVPVLGAAQGGPAALISQCRGLPHQRRVSLEFPPGAIHSGFQVKSACQLNPETRGSDDLTLTVGFRLSAAGADLGLEEGQDEGRPMGLALPRPQTPVARCWQRQCLGALTGSHPAILCVLLAVWFFYVSAAAWTVSFCEGVSEKYVSSLSSSF